MTQSEVLAGIRAALARVDRLVAPGPAELDTSLVDDLHLDSLRLVDLTVALEETLGIAEFPMQDWYDAEASSMAPKHFTLGSLLLVCAKCIGDENGGGPH